jgi:hypothetical protein
MQNVFSVDGLDTNNQGAGILYCENRVKRTLLFFDIVGDLPGKPQE